jgi:glycine cleavage system transcriptional repressor
VSEFAVTAVGRDRPGIVAAISGVLFRLGGNIEDSRMSILRGHFSVMLIVELPPEASRERLDEELRTVQEELGLEGVSVSEVERVADAPGARPSHVLTVYGADHPGIVHRVTTVLAERGVNVTDLSTQVAGGAGQPVYVMVMEVALGEADESELRATLDAAGSEIDVEVSLRPLGAEAL